MFFQVRYTGYRDRPQEERQVRFQNACREGHTEISFVATGTNLQLVFAPPTTGYMPERECDFDKEVGKVSFFFLFKCHYLFSRLKFKCYTICIRLSLFRSISAIVNKLSPTRNFGMAEYDQYSVTTLLDEIRSVPRRHFNFSLFTNIPFGFIILLCIKI